MAIFAAFFLAASLLCKEIWSADLAYKNGAKAVSVPAENISDEVKELLFDLTVIYIYSYDISTLIADWQWSPDGAAMPAREESAVDLYIFDSPNGNRFTDEPSHVYYDESMRLRGRTSSYMQLKKPFALE